MILESESVILHKYLYKSSFRRPTLLASPTPISEI